jgi:hypothetical protein
VGAKVCIVSFEDLDGTRHSVEVAAETLYEAAALAVNQFRRQELIDDDVAPGMNTRLEVSVKSPTTQHELSVRQLRVWLERSGKSPREIILKQRVRSLLDGQAVD